MFDDDVGTGMAQAALERAYLIVGADELKRQTAVRRLRRHLDGALAAFNLDEIAASDNVDAGTLIASLNTLPVGDTLRLVVITSAENLSKAASEALVGYLQDPNPQATLALVAERLARNTRLYKAVVACGTRTVVDCTPKKRWELPAQVSKMAAAHGVAMDGAAATELVARVGESTTLLDAQVAALAQMCRDAGVIGLSDVEAHVARIAEVRPWDLLDALCARNLAKALELYALMRNTSPVALTAMLAGRVRELICAQSLVARGSAVSIASELGRQSWQVKNHARWARGFPAGELEALLVRCAACDAALKSGADPNVAFTELMVFACGTRG